MDPARGGLLRDGEEVYLRQKTFQVLLYLLDHRHRLVSKDELMAAVWRDTAVTDDALVQCIVDLRKALGDDSRHPRFIRTLPKSGYRFVALVDEVPAGPEASGAPAVPEPGPATLAEPAGPSGHPDRGSPAPVARRRRWLYPAMAAAGLLAAAVALWMGSRAVEPGPAGGVARIDGRKTIAVMPFRNRSGAADLDWLTGGLADMLVTELARSPGLNVVGHGQLDSLLRRLGRTGPDVPLEAALGVARRAGAEVAVLGTFAALAGRIRIDVQVHEVATGRLTGTDDLVLDGPEAILTGVDLLALKLARALGAPPRPREDPAFAEVMTRDLQAYRDYTIGVRRAAALQNREAIELFERAIERDPGFAMAHARIGYVYAMTWNYAVEGRPYLERAFHLQDRLTEKDRLYISAWYAMAQLDARTAVDVLRKIIARHPEDIESYVRLARVLQGEERFEEAIAILNQAALVDPDAPEVFHALSNCYSERGRHAEAIEAGRRYVSISPEEPNAYDALGLAYQWAGEYEQAIDAYERALALKPDFDLAAVHLGNARYQMGQYRRALEIYRRYLAIAPGPGETARAHRLIGTIHLRLGDVRRAEEAARLEGRAGGVMVDWLLALQRGDRAALDRLTPAMLSPYDLPARGARAFLRGREYILGRQAQLAGDLAAAEARLREAVRRRPPTWDIDPYEDCLALFYLETGRAQEAVQELTRVLAINPRYPLARYHLAEAYERLGDRARAGTERARFIAEWREADEDVPELVQALARSGHALALGSP